MKKISLLLLFICFLFVTGCTSNEEKVAKTLNDFEVACNNQGFIVTDNMGEYQNVDYITGSYIATLNDVTIEMVIYDNADNASKAQKSQIEVFNTMKGSGAVINKDKGKNYYKYDMVTNGFYTVNAKVDNTLIFSRVSVDNKDTIEKILNEMGY